MKLAVVSDDGVVMSQHFGRGPYYVVFTIEGGKIVDRETRSKAYHHHGAGPEHHGEAEHGGQGQHGAGHDHGGMVSADRRLRGDTRWRNGAGRLSEPSRSGYRARVRQGRASRGRGRRVPGRQSPGPVAVPALIPSWRCSCSLISPPGTTRGRPCRVNWQRSSSRQLRSVRSQREGRPRRRVG